jgi:hypothetical protein
VQRVLRLLLVLNASNGYEAANRSLQRGNERLSATSVCVATEWPTFSSETSTCSVDWRHRPSHGIPAYGTSITGACQNAAF